MMYLVAFFPLEPSNFSTSALPRQLQLIPNSLALRSPIQLNPIQNRPNN